ncbi:unnamed protein product [Prunus brigantina]
MEMQMARRTPADENTDNNNKGSVWVLDQQLDQPMDEETKRLRNMYTEKKYSTLMLLQLAFQSLGVVYGDLGTSPLYVFYNTFPDGIVLSAVGGINVGHSKISNEVVVLVAVVILRGGKGGWTSLGGIMLRITGTEALFADLSHFPVSSIQIAFTLVVFPCLLLAYCGQAAYLVKNSNNVIGAFYHSILDNLYWPVFIVATAAAVVASQATITATFSLIKQALALEVVHTSRKYRHQIYIPEINWIVMILCIVVTAGFKNQNQIGNASGTAVCVVMLVTTLLMILVMILVWRCHWILVLIFTGLSLVVEGTYFSAVLLKVNQGGWVPLVIATAFFIIMYVWHYGTVKRFEIEMHSKGSMAWILGLGPSLGLVRVTGIGLVYELASGVPRIYLLLSPTYPPSILLLSLSA